MITRVARLAAPRLRLAAPRRSCSTGARTDGFTEALPRGDWVAPLVFGGAVRRASALPPAAACEACHPPPPCEALPPAAAFCEAPRV